MTSAPRATLDTGSFRSVPEMWNHRVGSTPDLVALRHRVRGTWEQLTWAQTDRRVRAVAHGLLALELAPEARCAILARTSVAWILADLGILAAGGATTTIFPTDPADNCAFILRDAACVVCFCDDDDAVDKVLSRRAELPELAHVVVFDGTARPDDGVITLDDLEAQGTAHAQAHPDLLKEVVEAITPDRLATLIYTSGTTGRPKGVELTHDAWVYEAEAIDRLGVVDPTDLQLLCLPLAHVFAKVMQVAFIRLGVPTAVDGNLERIVETLGEVRPTWMAAVPRIFEKAYNRIVAEAQNRGPIGWAVFRWAVDVGRRVSVLRRGGHRVPPWLAVQMAAADRLVFADIREAFGGRLRFLVSGGAPLALELATFYDAAGVLICEGYGLTESAAASCVNTPDDVVFGTVGRPLPDCEVRVADDGELLIRSRGVMRGYHHLPDETAAALTDDGWLHTGDIGRILPSGHVQITDRKKEILVTANGKNVAPAPIQQALEASSPLIAHALVHGDKRNFCTAVLALDPDAAAAWATREDLGATEVAALAGRAEVREALHQVVDDVNRGLPAHEKVRQFVVAEIPFTVDNGLLTPSMKVKRREVEARWGDALNALYEGAVASL